MPNPKTLIDAINAGVITETEAKIAALVAAGLSIDEARLVAGGTRSSSREDRNNQHWSADEETRLIKLWNDGVSSRKIARLMQRTPGAVNIRVANLRREGRELARRR